MAFLTFVLAFTLLSGNIIGNTQADEYKNVEVNTRALDFNNLNSIFNALKEYGPTKKPADQKGANQYTCTTVLAEEEVGDISWLRNGHKLEFPHKFRENDRRIRVQYNEENNKHHGEKIVLEKYLGGLIAEMQTDSKANKLNIYPVVILYSYYIPCSMIDHVCAQRLADDKRSRETKYSLVLGYSDYYIYQKRHKNPKDLTIKNIQDSFQTLRDGTIDVYYMIRDFSNQLSFIVLQDSMSDMIQTNLYNCLIKQPLAYCCSANLEKKGPEAVDDVSKVVTFSINSMIYYCKQLISSTRFLVQKMRPCLDKWMDENIGPDCQQCASGNFGREDLLFYTNQCLKQAWEVSKYVGTPDVPYNLVHPSWKNAPISWTVTPADFRMNNALYCYNPTLRPDSFCTITERVVIEEPNRKRERLESQPFLAKRRPI